MQSHFGRTAAEAMSDSEDNVFLQKCVLCEDKGSCCVYLGLPLCTEDRTALRAWKRGQQDEVVLKACAGLMDGTDKSLQEKVKPFAAARASGGSQAAKRAIAKAAKGGRRETITAKKDFEESATDEEEPEVELTVHQFLKFMKDSENMKSTDALKKFKQLYKDKDNDKDKEKDKHKDKDKAKGAERRRAQYGR